MARDLMILKSFLGTLVQPNGCGGPQTIIGPSGFTTGTIVSSDVLTALRQANLWELLILDMGAQGRFSGNYAKLLDADGGLITSNTTLGFSDPNLCQVSGSPAITVPTATAGFNGFKFVFKNIDSSTVTFEAATGDIDGAATLVSDTQYEIVKLQIINGLWNRV